MVKILDFLSTICISYGFLSLILYKFTINLIDLKKKIGHVEDK